MDIDVIVLDEDRAKVEMYHFKPDDNFNWNDDDRSKPNYLGERRNGKMTVLNYKNSHFNLIVNKNHMLYQKGSLKFQDDKKIHKNTNTAELVGTLFKEPNPVKTVQSVNKPKESKLNPVEEIVEKSNEQDVYDDHIHCSKSGSETNYESFKDELILKLTKENDDLISKNHKIKEELKNLKDAMATSNKGTHQDGEV